MTDPAAPSAPALAAARMAARLTPPFARGADTLALRLLPLDSSRATVDPYDFTRHEARFGVPPEPRYVVVTTRDIDVDTTLTVTHEEPGAASEDTRLTVPAKTVAGTSFLLDAPRSATARLVLLTMGTSPFDNRPQDCWTLTALLGTTAKLLWATGAERDELRRHAVRTLAQRHLPSALGPSLDLIGADLGVPRFPPLPHGFDDDTVALYHLDDTAGSTPQVADATAAHPGRFTGHPGTLSGPVQLGVPGRYGRAMAFRADGAAVLVPAGPDFDIGDEVWAGATVECFVRPDPAPDPRPEPPSDPAPQDGPVLSRRAAPDGPGPGWALSIGDFGRGLARNVRFTIGDGDPHHDLTLFADTTLPTDAFTHVAAVLDRITGRLGLFLDGRLRDWRYVYPLGPVASPAPLMIGSVLPGGFRGVVDEVRISSAARADFAPVLGEGDDHYRRRLELFRRWTLPTPANLTGLLNRLTGPIAGRSDALVVDDTDATLVRGTRLVRVRPYSLLPGESVDAAGRRRTTEASVVGGPGQEDTFDPAYLLRYDRTDVDFTPPPAGTAPADPHLMQVGVAECLDTLVTLVGGETTPPGRLLIGAAYDPAAADLRATGRAVLLGHSSVATGRLAALAHRAGFDYVVHRADTREVYAATALGDYFRIDLTPAGTAVPDQEAAGTGDAGIDPADLGTGTPLTLSLRPPPPPDAFLTWLVVPGGAGRGTLTPLSDAGARHRTASLTATAPGRLIVKADVARGRHTVTASATRVLRVGLPGLDAGATVAADGTPGAPASVVERPGTYFHQAFLLRHADPRVDYAGDDAHRMQPAVAEVLDALLAELARRGTGGRLAVTAAFDDSGDPPDPAAAQGRRLVLRHTVLDPSALARVAFAVDSGHLSNSGDSLEIRRPPGQLVQVRGTATADPGAVVELDEGCTVDLTASPAPADLAAAGLFGRMPGEEPRLAWASGTYDTAAITVGSSTLRTVTLRADAAGMAWVQASYLLGGRPVPYTFQVRLRPELDVPATVVTKDQHDLIMNCLNVLHPVGVEVDTTAIRAHVVELQGDLAQANPDYTYPRFRVRGPLPPRVRRPTA
ncbi:LamG-like jellyroll fold domain-containing protein [Streptomyces sp. NPDC005648]|uniref:LamG-like jellyroll fold domain-containing protein n=1 Tax=Streptomyces sp. NPDC005648 TaxID=3157044 RepID=UPI0033B20B56